MIVTRWAAPVSMDCRTSLFMVVQFQSAKPLCPVSKEEFLAPIMVCLLAFAVYAKEFSRSHLTAQPHSL